MPVSRDGLFHGLHKFVGKSVYGGPGVQDALRERLRVRVQSRRVDAGAYGLVLRVPGAEMPFERMRVARSGGGRNVESEERCF